ncbi:VTT domain-containing protein [Streptosporangium sp. NPDC023963]|uniref:DedA family protein n=1 Tax=Streptosporangium sp. NPDC023963 TaxID=3155608 RepID=UPI0034250AED
MLLDMLQSSSPYLVGSVLLAVLAFAGSLIPAVAAILAAGATLADPRGVAVVALAGCAGCVLYATGGWLVGRRYGSRLRHGGAGRRIGERRWSRAERLATATGAGSGPALAAAFFLPVVGSLTPIAAGASSVPYPRLIRWALAGGAAWVSVYLSLGALAGEALRQNQHLLVPILTCVAVVVAGLLVINHRARPPRERAGTGDAVSGSGGSPGPGSASRSPR